ncbi:NAD(P)-dependent malic enzyme [Candidatus Formimonas warabiya]|uniref:NAD-dependent malic enzyme n=1 Tax=Formimonas warabiya TaxID=1761012 RepID=A0A3G1KSK2_FORW1|nr:malic enzyme-like NAD(P)-binding protein [Candidatus Formimonas warabiya]ATW25407.1 NAD-dependent malic enzyme [Candidatus Formimonas warabiya]
MDYAQEALRVHKELKGKLEIKSKAPVTNKDELSVAYTPGVAEPCKYIAQEKSLVYEYTMKSNYIAVVTDGTAVLGLGDIGPEAGLPVMEGKCVLFKEFGGVDAVPICLDTKDVDEIVHIVTKLAPAFGGFNLEDISGPRCFEIERRLKKNLDIPIFHDDQHGTAVVVLSGLINALKIVGKKFSDVTAVVNGSGAAGISTARLLNVFGIQDVVLCDTKGAIYQGRKEGMNPEKELLAQETNLHKQKGALPDIIKGKDIFIGVSAPGLVTKEMIRSMNKDAIVFAMANPIPEIFPDEAKEGGARVVGTGRSDFANQVNNVLAFPGIFRGALDVGATDINEEMKMAAADALAGIVEPENLGEEYVIPKAFDLRVGPRVAAAVARAAVQSGVARRPLTYDQALKLAKEKMKKQK